MNCLYVSDNIFIMTTEEFNPEKPPKICPECNRKGVKKKVKQFYINLDEEVQNGKHSGANIFTLFADTWTHKTEKIWVYQAEGRLY